jgi:septal ring factor EnvC (AmiA/AmiB activator)
VISKLMLPLLSATALLAQNPNLPDLKAVLGLSDAQIQSLGQLEQQKAQAVQPIAQHIQQDQQQLDTRRRREADHRDLDTRAPGAADPQ